MGKNLNKKMDKFITELNSFLLKNHPINDLFKTLESLKKSSKLDNYELFVNDLNADFINRVKDKKIKPNLINKLSFSVDKRDSWFNDYDIKNNSHCKWCLVERFKSENDDVTRDVFLTLDNSYTQCYSKKKIKDKPFLILEDKNYLSFKDISKSLQEDIYGIKLNIDLNINAKDLLINLFARNSYPNKDLRHLEDYILYNYIFIIKYIKDSVDINYGLNLDGLKFINFKSFDEDNKFSMLFQELFNFIISLLERNIGHGMNLYCYKFDITYSVFINKLIKFLKDNEDLCLEYKNKVLGI